MVWPRGRICPACGYRRSTALAGRDAGRQVRPGLYQCSNGTCRFQFTVTTRTPLHSTKLRPYTGTGKTHLATGLCVAACRQRRRVRFTTATALVNELAEAAHANQLSRALGRWERLDLICIDELGYVPLAETACELMFQIIADRAEKTAVIVTTNLPFSEWSQVIPNPRLCKALIDRLTDRAHIITTGTESYRFRRTTAQRKAIKP